MRAILMLFMTTAAVDSNWSETNTPARWSIVMSGSRPAASNAAICAALTIASIGTSTVSFDAM